MVCTKAELLEISVVLVPANHGSLVDEVDDEEPVLALSADAPQPVDITEPLESEDVIEESDVDNPAPHEEAEGEELAPEMTEEEILTVVESTLKKMLETEDQKNG